MYNVKLLRSVFFYKDAKSFAKALVFLILTILKPSVSLVHRNPVYDLLLLNQKC